MSPLQFQKHLRLLEARRLLTAEGVHVAEAAHQVGYESASQFSREYSRMAFIDIIDDREINAEVRAMYDRQQSHYGYVPNYARAFCHRPHVM